MHSTTPLTTRQLHQQHDAAHIEAEALRREAMADFWRGADALLGHAWSSADRSARRLAHRLRRHLAAHPAAAQKTASCGR